MKTKAHIIQEKIDQLYLDLEAYQKKCKHKRATKIHDASQGNYDPMQNRYWTNFDCPTCLKKWTEDGSL